MDLALVTIQGHTNLVHILQPTSSRSKCIIIRLSHVTLSGL